MKKTTLAALALVCSGALNVAPAMAQDYSPTATSDIYNFSKFKDETLLDLFYDALQKGRNYPTAEEFEAKGILPSDIAFIRSYVRRKPIMDRTDRLNQDTYEKRELWCNLPMDIGQDGLAGYPDGTFASDVFSMWQYTNLFGSWNHGFFQAPGAWVDAAHKNGTLIMSGIKFFESWGTGDGAWSRYCTAMNPDGTYKYVEPLINCLMFFGSDGINFNWEDSSYAKWDIVNFHKSLHKKAAEKGFTDFQLGLYTAQSGLSAANVNGLFGDNTGRTAHTMLNYAGGDFSYTMGPSVQAAKKSMGTAEGLYAGVWIASMDRGWNRLNQTPDAKECGLCLWGEHGQSRFMSYNTGGDAYETQENYQRLLERGFSGGFRNPAKRPAVNNLGNNWEQQGDKKPLSTFCGISEFIPERSAIQGNLPFSTYFNLGNGDRYNYKGKKTGSQWYNMANQDVVPTYRWLVYNANTETVSTDIQPEFTHNDAYTGGTCLSLTGQAKSAGTDIILYKTALKVSAGTPVLKVAVKSGKTGANASNLSVIVRKQGTTNWIEVPYGDLKGETWEEKQLDLSALATNDVIDRIGLRVKGDDSNYSLLVGKLEITDDAKATPANIQNLVAEVKEETKGSMSLKLNWEINATDGERKDYGYVYNDEANISHYEILYKDGEKGRISEVGRTSQRATFINDIIFEEVAEDPYIGVRAVATDLKTYSDIEWLHVERAAADQLPVYDANTYGVSAMDPSCEGADIARQQRYVTDFRTKGAVEDINYHADGPVADGSQYANCLDKTLKVRQGQEIELFIKAADFGDGLKYCFAGGWIDLDGSGTFNPDPIDEKPESGERLFFLGTNRQATPEFQNPGITHKFTIPADARTGQSRLRIVFSDAWFAGAFQPTGLHAKGFSMDFNVEIIGDNEQRPAPADTHDQGVADEPEGLGGQQQGIGQATGEVSEAVVNGNQLQLTNVEKAWIYTADGKFVKYAVQPTNIDLRSFVPGVYLVRMMNANVIRTAKIVVE